MGYVWHYNNGGVRAVPVTNFEKGGHIMSYMNSLAIELDEIAKEIADSACNEINRRVKYESEIPYKAQYVLEEAIKILMDRV